MNALTPEQRILAEGGTIERIAPELGLRFGRLRVLTFADAQSLPPRRWLLRTLIAEGDLALIYGPPKSGKSFLTTRLLWGAALGIGFGAHDVTRAVRVLYCAAEGAGGFPLRLAALRDRIGDPGENFRFIPQRVTIGDPGDDIEALARAMRETRSEVICIDTVARTFGRGDENSARDMAAYVEALDRVREMARWPGAPPITCVLVHHGAKHGPGSRGSTVLPAAVDAIIRCERIGSGNVATVEAAKDAPDGLTIPFKLTPVALPPNPDGEPQATCIAEPTEQTAAPTRDSLSPQARAALSYLGDVLLREGRPLPVGPMFPRHSDLRCVPMKAWRRECAARSLSASEDRRARNAAFARAAEALTRAGYVATAEHDGEVLAWIARGAGA